MAKAAAINLNDSFSPPGHAPGTPGSIGDLAATGTPLNASARLSGQVQALASAKERAISNGGGSLRRTSQGPSNSTGGPQAGGGAGLPTGIQLPPAPPNHATFSDTPLGGQQNARLPPLMHGYANSMGASTSGRPHGGTMAPAAAGEGVAQPVNQMPGPAPVQFPWQPRRKAPSAFLRNNPTRQQLEHQQAYARTGSAGPGRPLPVAPEDAAAAASFSEEVVAAAAAAMASGASMTSSGMVAAPPWGVSSVSDLEALDSILDQLVVVDARMRKALLKGPMISFETVVPEHMLPGGRPTTLPRVHPEDERDHTFLTSVKGVVEGGEEEQGDELREVEGGDLYAQDQQAGGPAAQLLPVPEASQLAASGPHVGWSEGADAAGPRDSALFRASIPNTGMHPSLTRAYLSNKLAPKQANVPPPPPATAEHLLRTRPPPFIAAPSYDSLCSQIRDVQRQYTCGTTRPPGGGPVAAAAAAAAAAGTTANQYISGLDGPPLVEVVAHQDLPISLERVRPTFVALSKKAPRAPSPKRRPGGVPSAGAPGTAGQELTAVGML